MSNENSTTNSPRRVRNFCLTTYLNNEQVAEVLRQHDKHVRAYAYIEHDKDVNPDGTPKERHIHLLIRSVNAYTVESVRNWFKGYTDINGLPINTLGQVMHDVTGSFEYLTHDTEQARADGKYLYPKEAIISNNVEFFKDSAQQEEDNISLALCELLDGVPLQEVAKKYGRDFIIHFHSIKELFNCIQKQNGGKEL